MPAGSNGYFYGLLQCHRMPQRLDNIHPGAPQFTTQVRGLSDLFVGSTNKRKWELDISKSLASYCKLQVRTLPEVPSSLLHAHRRQASLYYPASFTVAWQRFPGRLL